MDTAEVSRILNLKPEQIEHTPEMTQIATAFLPPEGYTQKAVERFRQWVIASAASQGYAIRLNILKTKGIIDYDLDKVVGQTVVFQVHWDQSSYHP